MPILAYTILLSGAVCITGLAVIVRRIRMYGGQDKLAIISFVVGFAAAFPTWLIEKAVLPYTMHLTDIAGDALRAFCVAGLAEESVKLIILFAISSSRFFRRISDGPSFAVAIGLGFAFSENIFFSLENPLTLFLRNFTSVPLHALTLAIPGWCLGMSRFAYKPIVPLGFFAAVILHGVYNFFLLLGGVYSLISFGLLIPAFIIVLKLFRHARELDEKEGRFCREPSETD